MGSLDGCRVLDLCEGGALLAGRMLADLGADVVVVEPAEGSPTRHLGPGPAGSTWAALAANKRSVVLDLESTHGRERLANLVAVADIVVESSGNQLSSFGLGPAELSAVNPRLVHVAISPFGSSGPKADYASTDLIVWAAGGALDLNRDNSDQPLRISSDQAFLHAGADAACGALAAFDVAERTGLGQRVEVSAQASLTICTLGRILAPYAGDDNPDPDAVHGKIDQSGSGTGTRRSKWPCVDGLIEFHLAMGAAAGHFTNRFFTWMAEADAPLPKHLDWDWLVLPAMLERGEITQSDLEKVRDRVGEFFQTKTKAQVTAAAMERRLLCVGISDVADLAASPQLAERGFWCEVGDGDRRQRLPGRFACASGELYSFRRAAPELGEHTSEVLSEWLSGSCPASAHHESHRRTDTIGPLDGLRVLDLSWVVAGPVVGRTLADLGATVIRVESRKKVDTARLMPPFQGGTPGVENSALYETCNAGKLGLSLDLSTAEGRELVRRLSRWADVVVESFAPGQMARWGLDYDSLREGHEDLVMVSSSLMGQSGSLSGLAGFGNIGAAMSGYQQLVGVPGELPIGPFGPYTDFLGPRVTLIALLGALRARRTTGRGCYLDVAQAEAGVYFLGPELAAHLATGHVARPHGNRHDAFAPHGVYRCRATDDGCADHLALTVRTTSEWQTLARAIGRTDWAEDPALSTLAGRRAREDEIDATISAWTASRRAQDLENLFQRSGVPAHVASTAVDAMNDAQLAARGHFTSVDHPLHGSVTVEGPRFSLSATPARVRGSAPRYGEHNHEILRQNLGLTSDEIAELERTGVLT
ncbi:CaiB/BaiF CoA-transferase family protein [Nocardioides terrisoli]|uniref:CaiB/BaiF CoA-transferase family protein n=1 Tax=Nocardioides terrisoli TaxID=3388267 RepID=UPI00287B7A10|nr:CoA transferase [Nocardioides marmorisolisilvae]